MKKLLLLAIGSIFSIGAFAQSASLRTYRAGSTNVANADALHDMTSRTTAIGGTDTLTNWSAASSLQLYIAASLATTGIDSGFCAGMDTYGDSAFAERYDFTAADSSLQVIGVIALFGGTVKPSSTNHVDFNVWSVGSQVAAPFSPSTGSASSFWFDSGFPNSVLATQRVPFTQLGISTTHGGADTAKVFMFTTPTAYLSSSFFVGYSMTYTYPFSGDTIGLYSDSISQRTSPEYSVSGTDSIVNNVNATEFNDGTGWHDDALDNFFLDYDLFMFPVVKVGNPLSVNGVTRNNLTFFGNYPNPASDNTNIKFSLANSSNVTITIKDMAGRTVNTINETNMASGMHIIPVATANMPAGDYIYLIRTASNDGMAGKMTIIK